MGPRGHPLATGLFTTKFDESMFIKVFEDGPGELRHVHQHGICHRRRAHAANKVGGAAHDE